MRAFTTSRYGGPEVLSLANVPETSPADGEVLIKIHAIGLNPADWHVMRGSPAMMRLSMGLRRPGTPILGADIAGTVEAIGARVTRFKRGDEVFADLSAANLGAFAECVAVSADFVAAKPANLSFAGSAAIPLAGITALQALNKHGALRGGQTVLINGASGGVGHFAVQIAKASGAVVTGISSGKNAAFVKELGADEMIDYTAQDFTKLGRTWDLVIDCVGNQSLGDVRRAIGASGKAVIIGFSSIARMMSLGMLGGKAIAIMSAKTSEPELATLAKLAEDGKLKPNIDKTYPFAELPAAMAHLETGRVRGKLAVEV